MGDAMLKIPGFIFGDPLLGHEPALSLAAISGVAALAARCRARRGIGLRISGDLAEDHASRSRGIGRGG